MSDGPQIETRDKRFVAVACGAHPPLYLSSKFNETLTDRRADVLSLDTLSLVGPPSPRPPMLTLVLRRPLIH